LPTEALWELKEEHFPMLRSLIALVICKQMSIGQLVDLLNLMYYPPQSDTTETNVQVLSTPIATRRTTPRQRLIALITIRQIIDFYKPRLVSKDDEFFNYLEERMALHSESLSEPSVMDGDGERVDWRASVAEGTALRRSSRRVPRVYYGENDSGAEGGEEGGRQKKERAKQSSNKRHNSGVWQNVFGKRFRESPDVSDPDRNNDTGWIKRGETYYKYHDETNTVTEHVFNYRADIEQPTYVPRKRGAHGTDVDIDMLTVVSLPVYAISTDIHSMFGIPILGYDTNVSFATKYYRPIHHLTPVQTSELVLVLVAPWRLYVLKTQADLLLKELRDLRGTYYLEGTINTFMSASSATRPQSVKCSTCYCNLTQCHKFCVMWALSSFHLRMMCNTLRSIELFRRLTKRT
jgi:hypothetical protein